MILHRLRRNGYLLKILLHRNGYHRRILHRLNGCLSNYYRIPKSDFHRNSLKKSRWNDKCYSMTNRWNDRYCSKKNLLNGVYCRMMNSVQDVLP